MWICRASLSFASALPVLLALGGPAACRSKLTLDSGVAENHVYHSLWFHFTYRYPASTTDVALQSLHFPPPSEKGALLFAAREFSGDNSNPSGVILYVDELSHYRGQVKNGSDYLRKIERAWPTRRYGPVQSMPTPSGITFYRVDYSAYPREYDSAVCGTTGDYALVFKFNAGSQSHLDALVSSISSISSDRGR